MTPSNSTLNGGHVNPHAQCEGEAFPESHRAHLVVAINRSAILAEGELSIVSPELVNVGKQTAKLKTRAC